VSNSVQASKTQHKRVAWSWLRLEGVSFTILPFEERDNVLRDYAGLLSSVKRGVLLARRVDYEYKYSDYSFSVSDTAFYLKAPAGSQVVYFNPRPEEPMRPRVKRLVNPATLELEDNTYARVLVAYGFPAGLPEGLLYTLYTEVSEVALVFREVDKVKAVRMVETARRRRLTSSSQGVTEAHEATALEELASRVLSGSSLFEFYLYFIIKDRDPKALNARSNTLKSLLKGYGVDLDAPPLQRELYNLETCLGVMCVEKHYADSESLKPLFPLISEELHDENGVFLGVSGTGSPVLLDVWSKPNLNFVIVGVTGSGKSMTAKVYLKRLREVDNKILYVGVDPESEYTRVAGLLGAQAVEIHENQRLGLDPIKLLRSGALELGQVADIVSEVYGVPENLHGVLRRELFMNSDFADSFVEFASSVKDSELSKYLQGATVPPDSLVYEGEPPPLAGSVVFGLKNVRSKRLKILISALISAYAYNTLLSKARRSVFFVNEAWLFMETPSIVSLFENLARRGRKHGVAFLYITQRAEDLARTPQGRTILEQSATVLLLRQEPEGRDACKEIYKLSDSEAEYLVNAPVGSGILKAGRKRITVQVLPTEDELKAFSTSVS
jgi:type IV secretion system protein VirB4